MYLFDTDTLSNLLKRVPSPALIGRLMRTPSEQQFTSSITLGELIYGATRQRDRTTQLLAAIDQVVLPGLTVLPFDDLAARRYGTLRAALESRGTPLAEADLRIASIALARGLAVITGNVAHFQRVPGLAVENWLV